MKMSREVVVPSKEPKKKGEFSRFLFDIVQQFSLDEFKKFTNFADVMKRVLDLRVDPTKQRPPLEHYIKQNFKKTANEQIWKKGGFVSLKLTDDFYGSETAARIFRKIYGVKNSKVVLSNVVTRSNKVDTIDSSNESDCELFEEFISDESDDESPIEKIDLTKDDHLTSTSDDDVVPPRRIKYPRKGTKYMITEGFSDEIVVSSTEPAVEIPNSSSSDSSNVTIVHQMTEAMCTQQPKINVISDILLVPPTPFRNEPRPDPKELSPPSPTNNQQPEISKGPVVPTSAVLRKPETLMHTDSSIGPPSNRPGTIFGTAANPSFSSTQELLRHLQHTDPETFQPLAAQKEHVPEPASPVIVQASAQNQFLLPPAVTKHRNLSKSLPSIPTKRRSALIVEKPSAVIDIPRTSSPVRLSVTHPMSESPTHCGESTELINNFTKSFEAQQQCVRELFAKYVAETEPSALSLKNFWFDFFKSHFEQDCSAAETQLNNSNENMNDVQMEQQSQAVINPDQLAEEPSDFTNVQVKLEKMFDEGCEVNESNSSDVQIIEQPANEPIVILESHTQDLLDVLKDARDTEEQLIEPFAIPQQSIASSSNVTLTVASSKKGFLTALPTVITKKLTYPRLDIVVESAQNNPPAIWANHSFSQQPPTPPSNENYEIEECTMTDSQHQRYELLNNENTIFLSSQLDNYAFNAGKSTDPKPFSSLQPVQNINIRHFAQKRPSIDALNCQPYKRRRCAEAIKRELNWKVMDIGTVIFKPFLPNNSFHIELQLRNNFDTFHVQDQQSIKRLLHLRDNEWKHVAHLLTALNGYRYDCSKRPMASQKNDLMSRVMHCFMQSIPVFVRCNIQFVDFMGHCLEAIEPLPLVNKCTDSAIDSDILKRMEELKKNLSEKMD